ncbi:MAG: aspartate/glutamate racemase family protein [Ignavibacteriales bacterium]
MTSTSAGKRAGPALGVIMLDTRFPRVAGDIGNPATFDFPVIYRVVAGASPARAIGGDPSLLGGFIDAAVELEKSGACAITTSCGFLALFQGEMAAAVRVPVFASSLVQIPLAWAVTGKRGKIGVLTAHSGNLTPRHLRACGWTDDIPVIVAGLETCPAFAGAILSDGPRLDVEAVQEEVRGVTANLVREHPDAAALVLECTNLPPYAPAIREVTSLPVFDIVTLARMVYSAVARDAVHNVQP